MNTRWIPASLRRGRLILGLLLALVSLQAFGQAGPITTQTLFFDQAAGTHDGNYLAAQAGLIYTNNVDFSRDPQSDELAMIGLVGDMSRTNSPRLDYHLDTDIALVKYFSNTYDIQPFGYLDGDAQLKIIPGVFSWTARDSYTQAILDPFAAATPDNIESLNYISTGPKFVFTPTLQTTIILTGDYAYVASSSKSPNYVNIDSNRDGGALRFERAFSSTLTAYVTGSYYDVKYTDTVDNTDFTQKQVVGGIRFNNFRTEFQAEIGYTKLALTGADVMPGDQNPDGVNWKVDLSRLISPTQRISLHAMRETTDAANLFRLSLDNPVPSNQNNQIVPGQPFTHKEYGLAWRLDGVRSTLDISAISSEDRYDVTPESNRDAKSLAAVYTRKLNALFSWDVSASYEDDDYTTGGTVKTIDFMTTLRWRLGERLALRFLLARSELSPNGVAANEIGVTATYALTTAALTQDPARTQLRPVSPAFQPRFQ
jgi:hypothetical protein